MSIQSVISANCASLTALKDQIEATPANLYTSKLPPLNYSLGEQVRHIIDHYLMLLIGLDEQTVCYDNRERNPLLERSATAACSTLDGICSKLQTLTNSQDIPLTFSGAISSHSLDKATTSSTLARELMFIHSHTIHHQAIISLMLKAESITVPDDFGVAPATLLHRRK